MSYGQINAALAKLRVRGELNRHCLIHVTRITLLLLSEVKSIVNTDTHTHTHTLTDIVC